MIVTCVLWKGRHTFDLFETLLMEPANLGVLVFQALKALREWVGNFQAVVPIGNVTA